MVATDLDPRFTFDSFVVGPANRLASAAARRAADAPGTSYNPLFIYSSSGLGKSHILSGIANHATKVHPEYGVVYLAVEVFLDELTRALQEGTQDEMREQYEGLHILLLDDVQFLTGQKEAQEMLLRLLDQLSASGGQIVLASDRPPSEIDGLDERLVTRFSGGLIVDIGVPEYETKVAILRKKAEERDQTFEAGVAEALAKYSFKSVRELAGALNKVLAIQELEGRQVTVEEIEAMPGLHQTEPASEGSIAGQQLLDEFGSFMEELSQTVATKVEREEAPWRRLLRETVETFERDGYSVTRLWSLLESDEAPPDPQAVADEFRRDVTRLRQIAKSLDRVGNPWPEAAVGLLKDPERLDEAEALLASAVECVRPFPLIGEGPLLEDLTDHYPAVVLKAAEQLVTEERPEYNPLFLWSPQPGGPLAMLAATARSFREHDKLSNVAIVSAQEFSEDFIRALSEGVAGAWRERWWGVDLLLVYDVQALSDTERAQDEFFHLFEASKRKGAKILITADREPSGITGIDDRLSSRFEMGLVVEATGESLPPGAETLNLEEAPPAYIQDEDLWSGFIRPKVGDAVVPPLEELDVGDRGGMIIMEPEEPMSEPQEAVPVTPATVDPGTPWQPSRENVVWDWAVIEDGIVEVEEEA